MKNKLITFSTIMFTFVLMTGNMVAQNSWTAQTCESTACKANFPARTKEEKLVTSSKVCYSYNAKFKNHEFQLLCTVNSKGGRSEADAAARSFLNVYLAREEGTIQELYENANLGDFAGKGMRFTNSIKKTESITHVMVKNNVIYQLVVSAPEGDLDENFSNLFFDSFSLMN